MPKSHLRFLIIMLIALSFSWFSPFGHATCRPKETKQREIEQKTSQFFRFNEELNSWVPVELPYDLIACVNENCTVVGSIRQRPESRGERNSEANEQGESLLKRDDDRRARKKGIYKKLLPLRKRVSLTRMSETSIWVTGESGSIFERFWNGVQWVIAPHDLASSSGPAISVFIVNQTLLALSEAGYLYQMQLTESSQLHWTEFAAAVDHSTSEKQEPTTMKSGVVTNDRERIYFCTTNGSLLVLDQTEPPRFINHGHPPGADVAAVADVGTIRPNLIFTISSAGDLYEHDRNTKPPWKKHIWREGNSEDSSLIPTKGCTTQGLGGASSMSLFLLTKTGKLVERRLNQRKWKWIVHGSSENQLLTSITPVVQDEDSEKFSFLLTTTSGSVLEYQITKRAGISSESQSEDSWVNLLHPLHAKVAKGVQGVPYQFGRTFFSLDDGRLAELHLPGFGGEKLGPVYQVNNRRKIPSKYLWAILDTPETEGWNAGYCSDERGPSNCIMGVKDETQDFGGRRTMTRRRTGMQHTYLIPDASSEIEEKLFEEQQLGEKWVNKNFHMRVMQGGRSFFMVTERGLTFEYLYSDSVGLWLRHENPTPMNGAVGSYNGSLFIVDIYGNLLIRERSKNELQWINCTAMKKGRQIIGGPPWDRVHGTEMKVRAEDAIYFVSKTGRLLQFTVALRNFKWKDCKNPVNTKVATIVDQKVLRDKVVFVIGRDGRLYQYNTLSGLWHQHYQSHHLLLSRTPGTAVRPSAQSLGGSLFMTSEDGRLVEYHWNSVDGWMWVEHGTPNGGEKFMGAPGPSYEGNQLFLIGSDGKVYLRFFDQGEWKWRDFGFPDSETLSIERELQREQTDNKEGVCTSSMEGAEDLKPGTNNGKCDSKVAHTRPIPSAEDSAIFQLRDGRLAEMRRIKDFDWVWSRIIATPTSSCMAKFWAAAAS